MTIELEKVVVVGGGVLDQVIERVHQQDYFCMQCGIIGVGNASAVSVGNRVAEIDESIDYALSVRSNGE